MSAASCASCGAPVAGDARFCSKCGLPVSPPAPEERKLATVLFADVTGSTDLGEQLDPERLRALLRDYFSLMAAVIEHWGGTVEKYAGDAILAVWGVPVAREDDAERGLQAALEMLSELAARNDDFVARHGVRLGVRIGVNTGEVLAPLGAQPAGQFLVSGDPVNVAARLEQAAEPGSVLVGERTWSNARHRFEFGPRMELALKGKRDPVVARRLGQPISREAQRAPFQATMLGRERELETILGLLDDAVDTSAPGLALISGPAGIGKSRLLREFIAEARSRHGDLLVLRGRCLAAGHGITFWALGEILRAVCEISLDEPAASAAEKLSRHAAGPLAAIGLSSEEIESTIAALATSANLTVASNPLTGLDPEAVAEAMGRAWPRFLSGLARGRPVAVLVEDIHWADERMLRMLELLSARSQGALLLIATARSEFIDAHPGFAAAEGLSVVSIRPLTGRDSERLIEELLGPGALPTELAADIGRKADGNPFFLEEMLQRLIDEGALVRDSAGWRATDQVSAVHLPDSVHALLAARIDALPVAEKQVLQEAAVVGRIFWPGAIASSVERTDVPDVLRSLERRGLVSMRPSSTIENEGEYLFRHVLIRDVAYASVPKARRARLHAAAGQWIENLAGDRLDELGEVIAYHYATAVGADDADLAWANEDAQREAVRRRAFEVLVGAGASARHRFAIDKALELHGQALALASSDPERVKALDELGDDHEALFHGDDAVRQYLAALEVARRSGADPNLIARIAAKAGRMSMRWGAFHKPPPLDRIQAHVDDALAADLDDEVRATLLIAKAGVGRAPGGHPLGSRRMPVAAEFLPDLPERVGWVNEALGIGERLGKPELLYGAYDMLGTLYLSSGDYAQYRATIERQGELLDRLTSLRQQVDVLVSLASGRSDAGAFQFAVQAAEEAIRRAADLSPHERMHALWALYWPADALGNWDRMVELLPWYVTASAAEGDVTCAAVRAGPLYGAIAMARRGEFERARELVPVEQFRHEPGTFATSALRARYAALLGESEIASDIARRALADLEEQRQSGFLANGIPAMINALQELKLADELDHFVEVARHDAGAVALITPTADRAEGFVALARGDRGRAEQKLRSALAEFRRLGAPYDVARTSEMLAGVAREDEREPLLHEALATYRRLGAVVDLKRAEAMLGEVPETRR